MNFKKKDDILKSVTDQNMKSDISMQKANALL